MGGGKDYLEKGGFSNYNWEYKGEKIDDIKVIYNSKDQARNSLPTYSNTSEAYLRKEGNEIAQIRLYKNRKAIIDVDLNPQKDHRSPNGERVVKGVAHIHEWYQNKNGEWKRQKFARYLTDKEIKEHGEQLKRYNQKVKFKQ